MSSTGYMESRIRRRLLVSSRIRSFLFALRCVSISESEKRWVTYDTPYAQDTVTRTFIAHHLRVAVRTSIIIGEIGEIGENTERFVRRRGTLNFTSQQGDRRSLYDKEERASRFRPTISRPCALLPASPRIFVFFFLLLNDYG